MYICKLCNYTTSTNNSIQRHNKTIKHLKLENENNDVNKKPNKICNNCNKEFTFTNNFYRHRKTCKLYNTATQENTNIIDKCKILKDEITKLKKEHEYQLEIEKLKNELTHEEIEKKNLQLLIIISNMVDNINIKN
jgi:hypothetical protein